MFIMYKHIKLYNLCISYSFCIGFDSFASKRSVIARMARLGSAEPRSADSAEFCTKKKKEKKQKKLFFPVLCFSVRDTYDVRSYINYI